MNLDSQSLNIISSICSSCKITQVELNLIPAFIKSHRHGTDEGFHSGSRLVVGGSESSSDVFIVKHLYFESEVLLKVFNDHD